MTVKTLPVSNGVTRTRYLGKPIFEIITNGFFTVDREWVVKYWNKAAEKLLRVSGEEIIGKNLWEEFAGALPVEFYTMYNEAPIEDIPPHFEEYWAAMETWFEVNTYFSDDTLSVSFKSLSQPAQSGHTERQLKTLNELYQFVTEVTNDCLWERDFHTRELFWIDGGHKRVFGYQIENAIIPQSFWEKRIHPTDRPRIIESLNKILATGTETSWEDEYRFQRVDGSYAYVYDRGHIVYDGNMVASRMIGATQDITTRKQAETSLLESESKLVKERLTRQQEMTHAVLAAQEHERSEIGKELHDNLNQILGAAKLYIELAKTDEENRDMCLEKSSGFVVKVIEEIRRISKTLSTPGMVMGVLESIKILLDDLAVVNEIEIDFQDNGIDDAELDEKLQLTIFRIVQEQLNNILKHANATHAIIDLSRQETEILLRISDNGNGCSVSEEEKGVGNINIKSRAESCHGRVKITSNPGKGYVLEVVLPLNVYL